MHVSQNPGPELTVIDRRAGKLEGSLHNRISSGNYIRILLEFRVFKHEFDLSVVVGVRHPASVMKNTTVISDSRLKDPRILDDIISPTMSPGSGFNILRSHLNSFRGK